jgi:hypothetical protein
MDFRAQTSYVNIRIKTRKIEEGTLKVEKGIIKIDVGMRRKINIH